MLKAIFCTTVPDKARLAYLRDIGFNAVVIKASVLDKKQIMHCQQLGLELYLEIGLFQGKEIWDRYPDARPINQKGELFTPTNWYHGVCPKHPGRRADTLNQIEMLAQTEGVAGIFLDFIRYPCHWEAIRSPEIEDYCFCPNCLAAYEQEHTSEPTGDHWTSWKCQQITNYVEAVRDRLNATEPSLLLGMFIVPWRTNDFDSAIRRIIGQDLVQLSPYVDLFACMTYHGLCEQPPDWIAAVVQDAKQQTHRGAIPVIQTMDEPTAIGASDFRRCLEMATRDGIMLFQAEALLEQPAKLEITRQVLTG